jgi:hypothetical protein
VLLLIDSSPIGHYAAWTYGVHHNDPSVENCMFRIYEKAIYGVLNDWDLATYEGSPQHGMSGRTGTAPFMSLDLLTQRAIDGEIVHLYRHDLEAFVWILTYIFVCFKGGKELKNNTLGSWQTGNYEICMGKKSKFLYNLNLAEPSRTWKREWIIAVNLLMDLNSRVNERIQRYVRSAHTLVEMDDADDEEEVDDVEEVVDVGEVDDEMEMDELEEAAELAEVDDVVEMDEPPEVDDAENELSQFYSIVVKSVQRLPYAKIVASKFDISNN